MDGEDADRYRLLIIRLSGEVAIDITLVYVGLGAAAGCAGAHAVVIP
jgi:hypothetical protein